MLPDERAEAKIEKQRLKKEMEDKNKSMNDLEKNILAKRGNAFNGLLNYME